MAISPWIRSWPSILLLSLGMLIGGCARLPETTRVVQDDDRILVLFETDIDAPDRARSTRLDISAAQLTRLLRGFSIHPQQTLSARLLSGEVSSMKLFRERELDALTPVLQEALMKVGPRERIRFKVLSPGRNPRYWREVTGGWIKVRDHYFHLSIDYFHVEQPVRKTDAYDRNLPSPWTPARTYDLNFEPERFYVSDPVLDRPAVDVDRFGENASP